MTSEAERILHDSISSICGHLRSAASAGRSVYRREDIAEGSPKAIVLRDLGFTLSFGSKVIPPDPEIPWECREEGEDEDVVVDYADISGWTDPHDAPSPALLACRTAFNKSAKTP